MSPAATFDLLGGFAFFLLMGWPVLIVVVFGRRVRAVAISPQF
jgi:hypothetical protein